MIPRSALSVSDNTARLQGRKIISIEGYSHRRATPFGEA